MERVIVRDRVWRVRSAVKVDGGRQLFNLLDPNGGETLDVLSPPETVQVVSESSPTFAQNAVTPWGGWLLNHRILKLAVIKGDDDFAALYAGRISPEPYQFAPVEKCLRLPRPCLLIADDVGLGKTIEAGICILELMARGRGKRILLVLPPGLIPQWQDEMLEKFGLEFETIENAAALDRAQTRLSEGIQPWVFFNRVITSVEYLKKREVLHNALAPKWDVIVVDEAHYLAESGTPRNPYSTARTRLGQQFRSATQALFLLSATPHNGYSHSFRSLLEIVEPTDATFSGDKEVIQRRVSRNMIRRLKSQIYKTNGTEQRAPAFPPRDPVTQIPVQKLSAQEKLIFRKASAYCATTAAAAEGEQDSELVSFAMQIVKKRMLSSRAALAATIAHRLDALKSRQPQDEPPPPAEVRELQGDIPLEEAAHERIATRVVRSSIPKEVRRRNAEKKQLQEIQSLIEEIKATPDPKITALIEDLRRDVLSLPNEKAIIFTEYRDTLKAIREAFDTQPDFKGKFVELTGGLSSKKRQARMAEFEQTEIRLLLATDAASEGLNLQRHCRRIYHVELPWNPNRLEQRNGRVDRHGQTRNPIIRYLFYPDSPEDNVLDRLIRKISQMHDDRVSTPDILGILSGTRIEQALTAIDAEHYDAGAADSLIRVFDERYKEFAREVAPLVMGDTAAYGRKLDPHSFSADPIVSDDAELEGVVLERLGSAAQPAAIPHTYSLTTPIELRGASVKDRYPCFTLRRSVAVAHPARDVEFVTRLHPLFQAIHREAFTRLASEHSAASPSRRLAVRRHALANDKPFAIFTFCGYSGGRPQELLAVAVDANGKPLAHGEAEIVMGVASPPGEARWQEVAAIFERAFPAMQHAARESALAKLQANAQALAQKRKELAAVLREDAERYRTDRLTEIEKEERDSKLAEEKGQVLLLETRDVSGFQKRRAAVDTFHKQRLDEIAAYEKVPDPEPPQPLGVVFVLPAKP